MYMKVTRGESGITSPSDFKRGLAPDGGLSYLKLQLTDA